MRSTNHRWNGDLNYDKQVSRCDGEVDEAALDAICKESTNAHQKSHIPEETIKPARWCFFGLFIVALGAEVNDKVKGKHLITSQDRIVHVVPYEH